MSIAPGERVGVVGLNGAGKSTLSRILAGTEPADSGTVARRRGASVAYLEQVPHFDGDPTAFEAVTSGLVGWSEAVARHEAASASLSRGEGNLELLLEQQHAAQSDVERLGGWDRQHKVEAFLDHLGIRRTDAKVSSMSGGEQRRVALGTRAHLQPGLGHPRRADQSPGCRDHRVARTISDRRVHERDLAHHARSLPARPRCASARSRSPTVRCTATTAVTSCTSSKRPSASLTWSAPNRTVRTSCARSWNG